jgi:hypothetical protein
MSHPYFDNFIYALVGVSSLLLALDEPMRSDHHKRVLNVSALIIYVIFLGEFIVKSIVLGFYKGDNAYL